MERRQLQNWEGIGSSVRREGIERKGSGIGWDGIGSWGTREGLPGGG